MNTIKPRPTPRLVPPRCPYCHEDVAPGDPGWAACASCQARHHRACVAESPRCASCGEQRFLALTPLTRPPQRVLRRQNDRALQWTLFGVAACFLLVGLSAVALELVCGVRWQERGNLLCLGLGISLPGFPALCGWLTVTVSRAAFEARD